MRAAFRGRAETGTSGITGVLFDCFGRNMAIPGLPGGLIIYQGHPFPLKGHMGITWFQPTNIVPAEVHVALDNHVAMDIRREEAFPGHGDGLKPALAQN